MEKSYIDLLSVKAGRTSGVYLQGEVKGEVVYMPLTPDGARRLSEDLAKAAQAFDALTQVTH
ncbi:hypothetical protein OKW41_006202 [Paraburkholderia sp. UCT70]|uniref:hypothetical protein n=1 Tax=Paraburkholderia sp. UCT70 TaxID=2991068 RepID=UPI003D1A2798